MQRVARSAVTQSQLDSKTFGSEAATANVTDIKLPGADVSLTAVVSQIRALVGPKNTRIVGEITQNEGETAYKLRAHASGGENWVEDKDGADVEALIKEIAGRLVERFDPLVAAFYYFRTPNDDKLKPQPSGNPPESNLDRAISFVVGHLHRWVFGEISRRRMQRAAYAAIERNFAATNGVDRNAG